jgi:hypothetical protein
LRGLRLRLATLPASLTTKTGRAAGLLFVPASPALLMHGLRPLAQDKDRSDLVGVEAGFILSEEGDENKHKPEERTELKGVYEVLLQ